MGCRKREPSSAKLHARARDVYAYLAPHVGARRLSMPSAMGTTTSPYLLSPLILWSWAPRFWLLRGQDSSALRQHTP